MPSRSQILSYLPVTFAVGLALILTFVDAQIHPQTEIFQTDSLKALRTLNYQYQMSVKDILNDESGSSLIAELYQADALIPIRSEKETKGLVVSLKDKTHFLLLQPQDALSDEKLMEIADAYTRSVQEFSHVELDQEISLEGPVYDFTLYPNANPIDKTVELSSEPTHKVVVAVIDSGMDETHEIFTDVPLEEGWNTITEDSIIIDEVGHGTHIAGIIASNAPGISIAPYKIVDSNGGKLSNVLEAFSKAIEDDVDVINASFGVGVASYAFETLLEKSYDQGIIVVSAAGNSGKDAGFYPAGYAQTIAVGSVDAGGHQLASSNYGSWVDVAAYGYRVKSSIPDNKYGYKTGTSQATAFVSAAVARILMLSPVDKDMSFSEVLSALEYGSTSTVLDGDLAGTPIVQ